MKTRQLQHAEIENLSNIADDFVSTAQKVNDTSLQRKQYTEKAIESLEDAENAGGLLLKELKVGSRESILLRNRHDAVLNICRILELNVKRQVALIESLRESLDEGGKINKLYLEELERLAKTLHSSLVKGITFLEKIVQTSNEMILMDNLVQTSKKYQKERVTQLKKLTLTALKDAEKAVEGSGQNFDRGEELVSEIRKVPVYVENKNGFALHALSDMASQGADLAVEVNKSSKSQFAFAEKVNFFTRQLHDEALHIRELVFKKHELFTRNLENIAEVAVLVAVEFFEYLSASDITKHLVENEESYNSQTASNIYDLTAYIENACIEVESVANLNYDMTETISLNSKIEEKTVELTRLETDCFEKTKYQVRLMTEKTRFPVDGSAMNIENGRKVRDLVERLLEKIK